MKKAYLQPKAVVIELSQDGIVMTNSIPGGGEIDMGGRGTFDVAQRRSSSWEDYEN